MIPTTPGTSIDSIRPWRLWWMASQRDIMRTEVES
jgi:hypothetical protein